MRKSEVISLISLHYAFLRQHIYQLFDLISDPLALHHFRLLYTLAFRPVFLHRLWNLILDTKRPALMGSSVPLLTVISRGIRLSTHERDAIVPLLGKYLIWQIKLNFQTNSALCLHFQLCLHLCFVICWWPFMTLNFMGMKWPLEVLPKFGCHLPLKN